MGRLFLILIWTPLLVSTNGQVLFDDMGDRQRTLDLALHLMRTELQQFSQGIERMIMKEHEVIENIIETKISKIETTNNESLSAIQTEQRLLRQEIVSFTSKAYTLLNKSITNCLIKTENALNDIRNTSLYMVEQLSSGEVIEVLRYLEMISRLNNIAGTDCFDILNYYPDTRGKDGVYDIIGFNEKKAVYCDMTTNNGGWTVIQRRVNGSVEFYRNWTEYKNGFGFADHEYWIGNDLLHRLTLLKPQELRVIMERFSGEKAYAVYSSFSVGDEASKYQLQVNGYSGTAGDSLDYSNNMKFSTPDQDNDKLDSGNCAISYRSGWWFNDCYTANPNGQYTDSEKTSYGYIVWYHWQNSYISLKSIQLMIRPRT